MNFNYVSKAWSHYQDSFFMGNDRGFHGRWNNQPPEKETFHLAKGKNAEELQLRKKTGDRDEGKDESPKNINIPSAWNYFTEKTTLHGLCYVWESDRSLVSRIFWCLLLLAMASVSIYVLVSLLLSYREYPIKSVLTLRRDSEIETPSFTICLCSALDYYKVYDNKAAKKAVSSNFDLDSKDPEIQQILALPHSQVFYDFGFSTEDIILEHLVISNSGPINATKFMKRRVVGDRLCYSTTDVFSGKTSRYLPRMDLDTYVDFLIALPRSQTDIVVSNEFHCKGIFVLLQDHAGISITERPFLVSPGMATYVLVSRKEYKFLPLPYPSFGEDDCILDVNSENFVNPLRKFSVYTRDNCLHELWQNLSAKICGCVLEGFEDLYSKSVNECSYKEYYRCYLPLTYKYGHANVTWACKQACDSSIIESTHSSIPFGDKHRQDHFNDKDRNDYIHLLVQVKSTTVEVVKHEPGLTMSDIMATTGGFLGLYVGASIMTLVECLEFIVTSLKLCFLKYIWRK